MSNNDHCILYSILVNILFLFFHIASIEAHFCDYYVYLFVSRLLYTYLTLILFLGQFYNFANICVHNCQ